MRTDTRPCTRGPETSALNHDLRSCHDWSLNTPQGLLSICTVSKHPLFFFSFPNFLVISVLKQLGLLPGRGCRCWGSAGGSPVVSVGMCLGPGTPDKPAFRPRGFIRSTRPLILGRKVPEGRGIQLSLLSRGQQLGCSKPSPRPQQEPWGMLRPQSCPARHRPPPRRGFLSRSCGWEGWGRGCAPPLCLLGFRTWGGLPLSLRRSLPRGRGVQPGV